MITKEKVEKPYPPTSSTRDRSKEGPQRNGGGSRSTRRVAIVGEEKKSLEDRSSPRPKERGGIDHFGHVTTFSSGGGTTSPLAMKCPTETKKISHLACRLESPATVSLHRKTKAQATRTLGENSGSRTEATEVGRQNSKKAEEKKKTERKVLYSRATNACAGLYTKFRHPRFSRS